MLYPLQEKPKEGSFDSHLGFQAELEGTVIYVLGLILSLEPYQSHQQSSQIYPQNMLI